MSGVATAVVVTGAATAYYQSETQKDAANKAARAQREGTDAAVRVQREALDFEKKKYADYQRDVGRTKLYSQKEYNEAKQKYESAKSAVDSAEQAHAAAIKARDEGKGTHEQALAAAEAHKQAMAAFKGVEDYTKMEGKIDDEYTNIYERREDQRYKEQIARKAELYEESKRYAEEVYQEQKELLSPYVEGGQTAFMKQMAISGAAGPEAQKQEIEMIQSSPGFYEMIKEGEDAILANAAATGGVRGGDTQSFLAKYRPGMLRQEIQDKYNMYGGLASTGLSATGMQASAAGQKAGNIINAAAGAGGGVPGSVGGGPGQYNTAGIGAASSDLARTLAAGGDNEAQRILAQGAISANQFNWIPQSVGFLSAYGPNQGRPSYMQNLLRPEGSTSYGRPTPPAAGSGGV